MNYDRSLTLLDEQCVLGSGELNFMSKDMLNAVPSQILHNHWRSKFDNWGGGAHFKFCTINFSWDRFGLWTRIYEYVPPSSQLLTYATVNNNLRRRTGWR